MISDNSDKAGPDVVVPVQLQRMFAGTLQSSGVRKNFFVGHFLS